MGFPLSSFYYFYYSAKVKIFSTEPTEKNIIKRWGLYGFYQYVVGENTCYENLHANMTKSRILKYYSFSLGEECTLMWFHIIKCTMSQNFHI